MAQVIKVGLLGTGNISPQYIERIGQFDWVTVEAVADLDSDLAKKRAEEFNLPRVLSPDELFDDEALDIIVVLTPPGHHAEKLVHALNCGKHAFTEKPFATRFEDAQGIVAMAREQGLRVGSAPDTFMGIGIQTARKLIDEGAIGQPVAATAFMMNHGMETWHPNPEFYFKAGGGPLLDMGPYYLTALVTLIGPVRRVNGFSGMSFDERLVTSEPRRGQRIKVETATHISSSFEFANGAIGTMVMSFDTWAHSLPCIEIHGTESSLRVPDPNGFGGDVELFDRESGQWKVIEPEHTHSIGRGLGVADMAKGILEARPHRANGDLALHVTEIMLKTLDACEEGRTIQLETATERPPAMPVGLGEGELD